MNLPDDEVDSRQFESLAVRGRELLTLDEPERAAYTLSEALALWRGRPFDEIEEWQPEALEAAQLGELRLDAQEWWLDAAPGRPPSRRPEPGAWTGQRGSSAGKAVGAPGARAVPPGRQGEALKTIAQVRRRLVDELGLDPGAGLDTLEAAILRQDRPSTSNLPGTEPATSARIRA